MRVIILAASYLTVPVLNWINSSRFARMLRKINSILLMTTVFKIKTKLLIHVYQDFKKGEFMKQSKIFIAIRRRQKKFRTVPMCAVCVESMKLKFYFINNFE